MSLCSLPLAEVIAENGNGKLGGATAFIIPLEAIRRVPHDVEAKGKVQGLVALDDDDMALPIRGRTPAPVLLRTWGHSDQGPDVFKVIFLFVAHWALLHRWSSYRLV